VSVVATFLVAFGLLVAVPVTATLTAPTHTPKINVRWYYTVRVTQAGKLVAARMTAQIVDPVGGVHPVQFGPSTKYITNWPFNGFHRDYIIWPAASRGVLLKLRITVTAARVKRILTYTVTPHA